MSRIASTRFSGSDQDVRSLSGAIARGRITTNTPARWERLHAPAGRSSNSNSWLFEKRRYYDTFFPPNTGAAAGASISAAAHGHMFVCVDYGRDMFVMSVLTNARDTYWGEPRTSPTRVVFGFVSASSITRHSPVGRVWKIPCSSCIHETVRHQRRNTVPTHNNVDVLPTRTSPGRRRRISNIRLAYSHS
jgi:hypothetical protein